MKTGFFGPLFERRTFLSLFPVGSVIASVGSKDRGGSGLRAIDLRTAQMCDPIGLDDPNPALSWRYEGIGNQQAKACRIRVASSPQLLRVGLPDLWDSGWISDSNQIVAQYSGRRLMSRQQCYWIVTVRSDDGQELASEIAQWEMGLLEQSDWTAKWIAAESPEEKHDREAGAEWVHGIAGRQNNRSFRLSFNGGGARLLGCIAVNGKLLKLKLDGELLQLPPFDENAFGGRPAIEIARDIAPGDHVLEAELTLAQNNFGNRSLAIAAQIKLVGDVETRRITHGWLTRDPASPIDEWSIPQLVEPQPHFPWPARPARLMRRQFSLPFFPDDARVYIAALGGYDIWINGNKIHRSAMQPEQCDFSHHISYRVYDIRQFLRAGQNTLAVMISDGVYASYIAPVGRYPFGPAPKRLLLQLEANLGRETFRVCSDQNWKAAEGPLRYAEYYGGEDWDFAKEQNSWNLAEFDDALWDCVHLAQVPTQPLIAKLSPAVQIVRELEPINIRQTGSARFVVDFGQNFAGRVRLELSPGFSGEIRVRYAEILDANGDLDRRNLRAARAEDNYRLPNSGGPIRLEPLTTYQGFRYAEICGVEKLTSENIRGLVLTSALKETGLFRIEHPVVQKIWTNTLWSQRSNFVGIPTDCPQRDERLGWTGDAQVFWDTAAYNMDVGTFTRDWLKEVRAAEEQTGNYPLWAPLPDASPFAPPEPTPGWADAGVMLPYVSFLHYGDRSVVDENWASMRRYVDGVIRKNPDGIWQNARGADLGDWLAVDAANPSDETTPKSLIATAMLSRSIHQLAEMARWTGRPDEAVEFDEMHRIVEGAFATNFVSSSGIVGNGSQTSHILALAFGLVPSLLLESSAQRLVTDILSRGTSLSTGFLGTPLALDVLADTGHAEIAVNLLMKTDYPSWGYMVSRGATTMWERWNGDSDNVSMNSFNHYAFGAVSSFLYRRLAGICPSSPGFSTVRIAPLLDSRLGRIRACYDSVRGSIEVEIEPQDDGFMLEVFIPVGAVAVIQPQISQNGRIESATSLQLSDRSHQRSETHYIGPGRSRFQVARPC